MTTTAAWNRDSLLQMFKPKVVETEIESGMTLKFRQLTVAETDALREQLKADQKAAGPDKAVPAFGLRLLIASLINDDGAPIFAQSDLSDLELAANAPIEKMVGKVLEVNGFTKAVEKNSEATATVASASV